MGRAFTLVRYLSYTTVIVVLVLLGTNVLDFCRVTIDGEVVFSPHIEKRAIDRWVAKTTEFISGQRDGVRTARVVERPR